MLRKKVYGKQNGPAPVESAPLSSDLGAIEDDEDEVGESDDNGESDENPTAPAGDSIEQTVIPLHQVEFETPDEVDGTVNDGSSILGDDLSVLGVEELKSLTREELQELASKKVRQTMNLKKKQSKKQGAFRKRNRNKDKISVSDSLF